MTAEIALVWGLALFALVLFAWERLRVDAVAMLVLTVLMITGVLAPQEALQGFASVATITVGAMFVLSAGLRRTGALVRVGELLVVAGRRSRRLALVSMMVVVAVVSAFINNTAAVAIFIPVVIQLADELGISPSKLLLPLSFASMFGGVSTLIGTSTNLLVDAIAQDHGFEGFSMFEFTPLGLVLFAIGMAYLLLVTDRIPPRRPAGDQDLPGRFDVQPYLARVRLADGAPGLGERLKDEAFASVLDLEVVDVERGGVTEPGTAGEFVLAPGDVVRVLGSPDALRQATSRDGVTLVGSEDERRNVEALVTRQQTLVEAIVAPDSQLAGLTVAELDLSARHGAQALGLRQAGRVRHDLPERHVRGGDSLLLRIDRDQVPDLRREDDFIVVSEVEVDPLRRDRLVPALVIIAAVVALAALGILPIVVTAIAGSLAMVAIGALTAEEAYEAINWRVIFLLAGVIPLGLALEATGGAALLADGVVSTLSRFGPEVVLGGIVLATVLVTSVISNNAAAVLFAPIAIGTAESLGVDARPFLFGVTIAASMSFLTPVGYQTNTMVYGPGHYRFIDFVRIGGPLTLLVVIATTVAIPMLWPF